MLAARALYPGRVTTGHIVLAFRNKTDPDGVPLPEDKARKARITMADAAANLALRDKYSSCVDDITDRVVEDVAIEIGAETDTCDVGGAYFNGIPIPPEEGGRASYAFVPTWLGAFGNYPTHDANGRRNLFRIWGTCLAKATPVPPGSAGTMRGSASPAFARVSLTGGYSRS